MYLVKLSKVVAVEELVGKQNLVINLRSKVCGVKPFYESFTLLSVTPTLTCRVIDDMLKHSCIL